MKSIAKEARDPKRPTRLPSLARAREVNPKKGKVKQNE
jgi:hypothetical protein